MEERQRMELGRDALKGSSGDGGKAVEKPGGREGAREAG